MNLSLFTRWWEEDPLLTQLANNPNQPAKKIIGGTPGAATGLLIALLAKKQDAPLLLLTRHQDEAEYRSTEIAAFLGETLPCFLYPSYTRSPTEPTKIPPLIYGERHHALHIIKEKARGVLISTLRSSLEWTPSPQNYEETVLILEAKIDRASLEKRLVEQGYHHEPLVTEVGSFSIRGSLIDLYPPSHSHPLRLDFFGSELESIRTFDPHSQRSIQKLPRETILHLSPVQPHGGETTPFFSHLPPHTLIVLTDPVEHFLQRVEQIHGFQPDKTHLLPVTRWEQTLRNHPLLEIHSLSKADITFPFEPAPRYGGAFTELYKTLKHQKTDHQVLLVSNQAERLKELLTEANIPSELNQPATHSPAVQIVKGALREGFRSPFFTLLTDRELFGERIWRPPTWQTGKQTANANLLSELTIGHFVVHEHHGIGIYEGLRNLTLDGVTREFMVLAYAEGDKLYVPPEQSHWLYPYQSGEGKPPTLYRLGGNSWRETKKKAKQATDRIARELLQLYAARSQERGYAFSQDTDWQLELEASFPFPLTPDQQKAIEAVKQDMETGTPMDRLICGDVGYGKTEVAVRAAFKAAVGGKQVAVLVPTTLLAEQHELTFRERFQAFPLKVEMLSRFKTRQAQQQTLAALARGEIDVVIGTHRLLQSDVQFKNLGLVIIDEEQRFGVKHKERLKQLKLGVDILTLTATPIPRTLYFSLTSIKPMSVIATPPENRLPIQTIISPYREDLIEQAIQQELDRDGQVFYLYNRVKTIASVAARLQKVIPHARIAIAHGQMPEQHLADIMKEFMQRKIDILVSTTIIESGLDIPNANTMIVDHAHHFGLAELYQLRGRIGRSHQQAFAYLFYRSETRLTDSARARLTALQDFTALGSGYKLALRDLEIRGAGNLLGKEQHGHVIAIGFNFYCQLLDRAIKTQQGKLAAIPSPCLLKLEQEAYFPADYIPDPLQRTALYERLARVDSMVSLHEIEAEIKDRFGPLPEAAHQLLQLIEIKLRAEAKGIQKIESREGKIWIDGKPTDDTFATLINVLRRR